VTVTQRTWDLHISGVHAESHPVRPKHGHDIPTSCKFAGRADVMYAWGIGGTGLLPSEFDAAVQAAARVLAGG
jgi:hypothetical protein